MTSSRPLLLALGAAGSLALPAAAARADAPAFGAPIVLSASKAAIGLPVTAVSAHHVETVWREFARGRYEIVARSGSTSSGQFGPVRLIARLTQEPNAIAATSLAATPHGAAMLVAASHGVGITVAAGNGPFGAPQLIPFPRSADPSSDDDVTEVVAVGDHFVALAVVGDITGTAHTLYYAISDASGRFGALQHIVFTPDIRYPSVAVAPDGTLTMAWVTSAGPHFDRPQLVAYVQLSPGATTFGPVGTIAPVLPAGESFASATVKVVAGPGGTALTWGELGASGGPFAAELVPGATPVAQPIAPGALLGSFALALPAGGLDPVAVVSEHTASGDSEVVAGHIYAAPLSGGAFGPRVEISGAHTGAQYPLAASSASDTVVTWLTGAIDDPGVRYAVSADGGAFGAPQRLAELTGTGEDGVGATLVSSPDAVVASWRLDTFARSAVTVAILRDDGSAP
jgi:hypothetical protein